MGPSRHLNGRAVDRSGVARPQALAGATRARVAARPACLRAASNHTHRRRPRPAA
ncbi:hypothetical protein PSMK_13520 [Phycisphaera mikurensis NBRC 102666]|uniref:Uncharacterized protein n=1 Tax=Phycisphaera mikurensis (strain NBRC 102666 / KCTC 22515 / FYK2301M01) TaxID=1142394 RepID=I0IE23_PHYMF|nr:hypothetical protein PSMK_13520 [Phycisphaera mikurensis NBRC 102666]